MRKNGEPPSDPLDQVMLTLDEEQWDALTKLMENPPEPSEALKKLMRSKPPWAS